MSASNENEIFKFPRTSHLINLGGASDDDLVFEEQELVYFLTPSATKFITIEEKIDGGNMGFRLSSNGKILAQNRSKIVTKNLHPQYAALEKFIYSHQQEIEDVLENGRRCLFGEWLAAKHSIHYNNLPDYFIAYDIFDIKEEKFLDRTTFYEIMSSTNIPYLKPIVNNFEECNSREKIISFLNSKKSEFSTDSLIEGIYIRVDGVDGFLKERAKIVRGDFVCGNEEWSKHRITPNIIKKKNQN
jgi:atypical dual specificity phosphatase